jgi:hypothetical protein
MLVVALRGRAVEADLQCKAITRQSAQSIQAPPDKQHPIGQYGRRGSRRTGCQDAADVRKKERLAACHENLADSERCRLACDPPHPQQAERSSRRLRRGAHTAIITAQIAIEICVEPKPRAERTVGFAWRFTMGFGWRFTTSDYPTIATLLEGDVDQTIAREATPSFQLGTDHAVGTNDRHEIARAYTTQPGNQFDNQAGRKRFSACVELDIGSYRHSARLSRHSYKI